MSNSGFTVILPDGRLLGTVHDTVIETESAELHTHFVADPPADLVEGRIHVAVPWNWVRSVGDVVVLRWFPPTPIPETNNQSKSFDLIDIYTHEMRYDSKGEGEPLRDAT